jgi:predicted acetyltransferase
VIDDVRLLSSDEDAAAAWALGSLAFGYHGQEMPAAPASPPPGRWTWGIFDDGRLVAKAVDLEQGHWFGGRSVPASGIAGVAVAADQRGRGLSRRVLTRLLTAARDRGAAISTLFDTTPVPYRRLGWEEVGARLTLAAPTLVLDAIRPLPHVPTRAARPEDIPALSALYEQVARDGTGMMDRSFPRFRQTPQEYLDDWDGVTVATDGDRIVGYVSWDRGQGYDADAKLYVGDLYGLTADATRALLGVVGGWASVAPTMTIPYVESDPAFLLTGLLGLARVDIRRPWCLRLVDAAGAVASRGWPPVRGTVDLDLVDVECPWNTGAWRLELSGTGDATLERGGQGAVRFTPRGLASWYAGAASPGQLRRAGLLDGSDGSDALLAAATAGPPPTLLDYF